MPAVRTKEKGLGFMFGNFVWRRWSCLGEWGLEGEGFLVFVMGLL